MKLHRLKLENFRGVSEREVEFPDAGVVVLSGRNEIGKTSMIDALDALLELPDSSKHRRILDAQPAGRDVPVVVEAEFSIGPSRVVYTKQWLKRPATTLRHVAGPEAGRAVTGREAHDAAAALWATADTTLWAALRYLQAGGLEQNGLTDSAALRRALEHQAGRTRGDDHEVASLLERVGQECDRYWTPQRKRNARYVQAETACRDAEAESAAAAEQLTGITAVEDELADLTEEITDTDGRLGTLRAERAELDRSAERIEVVQGHLREARRRRDAAQGELDRARERADRRAELVAALATDEQRSAALAEELAAAEADLAPVGRRAEEAEQRRDTAQAAAQQARAVHRRAREDEKHLDAVERHRRVSATLESLETVRAQLVRLGSRSGPELDEDALDELERAERSVERTEAELAAGSARMELTALGEPRPVVRRGTTEQVPPEQPWSVPVTEEVEVELPGQWRVRVFPEQGIETRRRAARAAAEAFAGLLEHHAVASVAEARTAVRAAHELGRQVREAEAQRVRLLDGEDEGGLRDERDRLSVAIEHHRENRDDDAPLPDSAAAARQRAEDAEATLIETEDVARHADAAAEAARQALHTAQTTLHARRGAALEQERGALPPPGPGSRRPAARPPTGTSTAPSPQPLRRSPRSRRRSTRTKHRWPDWTPSRCWPTRKPRAGRSRGWRYGWASGRRGAAPCWAGSRGWAATGCRRSTTGP